MAASASAALRWRSLWRLDLIRGIGHHTDIFAPPSCWTWCAAILPSMTCQVSGKIHALKKRSLRSGLVTSPRSS